MIKSLDSAGKTRFSSQNLVYLALGSNISPRKKYIRQAQRQLETIFSTEFRTSSLYTTDPYQGMDQQPFINCCVCFKTDIGVYEVLERIWEIENLLGRERSAERWMSRTIDIDILLWNRDIINDKKLIVPHYDLSNRDFFLVPLLELDADLVNPKTKKQLVVELGSIPLHLKTKPRRILKPS